MKSILKLMFLLAVLAMSTSAQGQNLSTCLLLDMPFDGSIADQSSNSHTTSSSSTLNYTVDRKGNANGAVLLNGTSDFITLNSNNAIITTSSFSVSSWIRMSGAGGGGLNQNSLFEQRDDVTGSTSTIVMSRNSSGTFNFSARKSGSSSQGLVSASTIGYNQWYHLVMIVNGSALSVYVDGQLLGTSTVSGTGNYTTSVDYVDIGRHRYLGANQGFFNGAIDDFKIFNCAITAADVQELYCPVSAEISQFSALLNAGDSVQFSSANQSASYSWSVNGTQVSTDSAFFNTFSSSGLYQVVLEVSDGFCTDYDTVNVFVSEPTCIENGSLTDSLKLYYPFSGNAIDYSGNGFDGTTFNGPSLTTDRYGNANSAYSFDGVNDYIYNSTNSADFDYSERTVSMWFLPETVPSSITPMLSFDGNDVSNGSFIATYNQFGGLNLTAAGTVVSNTASSSGLLNSWNHIVMTRLGSTCNYYLNGELIHTNTASTISSSSPSIAKLVIGSHRLLSSGFFDGKIDDIRIYNRALSLPEINALYCPAQVNIVQNDTTIPFGTTLNLANFCNKFPHTWTINGTQVSTADTLVQTFSAVGMYEIVLSSTDGFCIDFDTVVVRILPEPTCLGTNTFSKISDTQGQFNGLLTGGDLLGNGVAAYPDIDGNGVNELLIGALSDDDGFTDAGAVYFVKLNTSGAAIGHHKISSDSGGFGSGLGVGDYFGTSVDYIGDLNNDGFGDIVVGAPDDDDGGSQRGAIYVLFLDSNGLVISKQKISDTQGGLQESLSNTDRFGLEVSKLGDLNNDGVEDIAVGVSNDFVTSNFDGSVMLLFMNTNGTVSSEVKINSSNSVLSSLLPSTSRFGQSIESLGDYNNDGFEDFAIGAGTFDGSGNDIGALIILSLDSNGVVTQAHRITAFENGFNYALDDFDNFGSSCANLGDIDGDGYLELAVGAWRDDDAGGDRGAIWVLSLDSFGYVFNAIKISSDSPLLNGQLDNDDLFGRGLATIGDFNNDGLNDLIVGARADDDGGADIGAVYLVSLRDTCCPLEASFTGDNNVCEGNAITFINTSQFGSSATTFAWYINDTLVASSSNLTYTFNQAGNVLVKLVANDSCERSFTMPITVHLPAVADAGSSSFICIGDSVQLSASGGISYQWSNPTLLSNDTAANPFAFPTATSIFSVTVTDTNGCVDADNLAIIVNPIPTFDVSGDSLICLGDSTTLVADNASLTYSWSPASSLSASAGSNVFAFPTQTTTYVVEGTDANSCSDTLHYTVSIDTSLIASVLSVSDALCFGSADGAAVGAAVGGTVPYNFAWPNGTLNDSVSALSAGQYTFTVSDAEGCADSAVAVIGEPDSISVLFSETPVVCFGESNGALNASPSGGTGAYTYAWSTGATAQNISGLTQGTYGLTITDANNCENTFSAQVTEPTVLQATFTASTDVSCFGGNNGSASIIANGGTGGYTYNWSNGATGLIANNLAAGQYFVTTTDANNCSRLDSIIITEPATAVTSATSVIQNVSCFGFADGIAQVNGIGGTPGYAYQWSNGSDSAIAVGLSFGTTYSVITTDTLGCSFTNTISVTQPTQLVMSLSSVSNITCNSFDDGVYQVQASQATAPYSYSWSTGATNDTIFGVSLGYKTVTVTDANACVLIDSIFVTEPSPRNDSLAVTQIIDCFGNATGAVSSFAQGGYGQYTYSWSNGSSGSNTIAGLATGWYTATVSDSGSCAIVDSIFVDQPTLLISTTQLVQNVSCFGGNDGSASAQGIDGTPPYSYAWSNGDADSLAENLSLGQYFVTITDDNNCSTIDSITIAEPTLLTATSSLDSNATCFGYANGIATANPTGGTSPYAYAWENGETTQQADSLLAGTRNVTVTDALGCTTNTSVLIAQPTAVLALLDSTKDVLCNGFYDGLAFTSASGGTGPHTFSWNTGDTIDDIDSLTSGTYILTVYDSIGCFDTAAVTIIELTPVVPNISWTNVTCFDGNDGAATTAATGGGTTYSYLWNTGDTTTFLNTLVADTFIVHVTDEFNCNTYDTAFVTEPDSIEFSFDVTDISCTGFQDGALKVDATGGTSTLTFAWSTGSSDSLISTLDSGYYSVTATDINGCFNSDSAYIFEPTPLVVSTQLLDSVDCFGNETGDALATAAGGVGNYQFAWSNGDSIDSLINVFSGTYTVTLTDSNNCSNSKTVFVNEPAVLALSLDSLKNARCKDELNGYLSVASSGGNLGYQYVWNTGSNDAFIDSLSDGNYSVTVTDARGCVDSISLNISEPDSLISSIAYTDTLVCKYDGDGLLTSSAIGGTLPYAYTWENGPNTNTYSALSDGTYRVTITDAQGCQDSSEFVIDALSHLNSQIDSVYDILCFQDMSGFIQASADSGTTPYVWNWSSGNITDSAFALSGGNYYYTVTDSFACVDSGNAFVFEPTQLTLSIDSVLEVLCFGDDDGQIFTTTQGGIAPYNFAWSNGDVIDDINALDSGMYTLVVTDDNGCQINDSALIMEPAAPLSTSFVVTDANCLGGATGSIETTPAGGSAPFEITWSTGDTTAVTDTLFAGWYYVTITDDHGCIYIDSAEVFEPLAPDTAMIAKTNVSCYGFANGVLTSTFVNGISPFSYTWNNGETTASSSSLDTGNYDVLIIDSIGCTQVAFDTITQPDSLLSNIAQIDSILCFGDSTASLQILTIGGTQPYAWTWNTGDTSTFIEQLAIGDYSLTLTDALGCVDSASIVVNEPTKLVVDSLFVDVPSCYGFSDAKAFVAVSGGVPNYFYSWTSGETIDTALALNAGNHAVTVVDANGCSLDSSFFVDQPDSLIASLVVSNNANCDNSADGWLMLDISGGRMPYESLWSTGSVNITNENSLPFGSYSVIVNDAFGCTDSSEIFLPFDHLNPNLDLGEDQIFCDGFTISLFVPDTLETINWSTGETSPEITIDETNEYIVNVADSFGCLDADTIFIEKKFETLFDLGNDTVLCSDLNVTQWPLSVPGFANYNWSDNTTASSIMVSVNGSYWLEATNEFGCVSSDTIALSFEECYSPMIYPIPTLNELFIEWPKVLDEDLTFSIIGMNGQVVYSSQRAGALQHTLELGNLASGVYYLTIIGAEFNREFMIVKI